MREFSFKHVTVGIILVLTALLLGESHGLAFGAREDAIKNYLLNSSKAAVGAAGSSEEITKRAKTGWKYLKRGHMHFMGLGAVAMVLCIFIGHSPSRPIVKYGASSAVGFGALIYPLFWTFVSLRVPELGKSAAKESLELMALAGAGIGLIGLIATIVIALMWISKDAGESQES